MYEEGTISRNQRDEWVKGFKEESADAARRVQESRMSIGEFAPNRGGDTAGQMLR